MANSFIESFSETTQDKLIKSMLECSILFSLSRNESLSNVRKDMFLRSVFAITCSEDREWTEQDVHDVFKNKFSKDYNLDIINSAISKLKKDELLHSRGCGYVPNAEIAKNINEADLKIKEKTETVFNAIIEKARECLDNNISEIECIQMRENIKNAFNLYFRMYGFESFVSNNVSRTTDIVEEEDIVEAAMKNLDKNKGETLVCVLSDLLEYPTKEQASTLELLVRAFISTQVMRLDPLLSEFEIQNLKDKKFVLDTDFLLYCLVTNPKQSKSYRQLLKVLRKIGCQLIIPEEVVTEVLTHAQCAEKNYCYFATTLKSLPQDAIELKANNVFVKDYCLYRLKTDGIRTIKQYMENRFLSEDDPLGTMKKVIVDSLKIEPDNDCDLEVDQEYQQFMEELTNKIFNRTKAGDDKWRSDDEIEQLSRTDAKLYLSVLSLNKEIKDSHNGELLKANAYLVTGTTKSIKSACEMGIHRNFVTRPELLINLMAEIGEFDEKRGFVNLFDNPFLTYVIDKNWEMIKNLSEVGLDMHDKNITMLSKDLGVVYHKYLTKDAADEVLNVNTNFEGVKINNAKDFFAFAEAVNKSNYKFIPDLQNMVDEYKEETKKREEAEEKQRNTQALLDQKARGYKTYLDQKKNQDKKRELKLRKKR